MAAAEDHIHHPGDLAAFNKIKSENKLMVVDFFADWCGPCRRIAPKFTELAAANAGRIAFVKVDVVRIALPASRPKRRRCVSSRGHLRVQLSSSVHRMPTPRSSLNPARFNIRSPARSAPVQDAAEDIAALLRVEAMPTFVFFRDGVEVQRLAGANEAKLVDGVAALLA
jgi:thiol-disulfide isomerase/thioredoxin